MRSRTTREPSAALTCFRSQERYVERIVGPSRHDPWDLGSRDGELQRSAGQPSALCPTDIETSMKCISAIVSATECVCSCALEGRDTG